MKKTLFTAMVCVIVSLASASVSPLEDSPYYTNSGVFSLANGGFSSFTWAYDDTSKTSFTLEGYGWADIAQTTASSSVICEIKGVLDTNGDVSSISFALDNSGVVGAWSDLYNGAYTIAEAEFTDYGDTFRLLMTAANTTEGAVPNQILYNGQLYDRGIEFQGQSWVVDDYTNRVFTNARVVVASKPIPEPATLAILGLGSLFLIRKRK